MGENEQASWNRCLFHVAKEVKHDFRLESWHMCHFFSLKAWHIQYLSVSLPSKYGEVTHARQKKKGFLCFVLAKS